MPCISIHLAVAKKYVQEHGGIDNVQEFYNGNVYADLDVGLKAWHKALHFDKDYKQKFVERFKLDTDFNKGMFCHVMTDYLFLAQMNIGDENLKRDLYYTYDVFVKDYMKKEYGITYDMTNYTKEINELIANSQMDTKNAKVILSPKIVDDFIKRTVEAFACLSAFDGS